MPSSDSISKDASASSIRYIGPIVLGMNDALVEMTGALAGFTMALHDTRLISLAGLTTGVAATLSMGAAEFLAKDAARSAHPWRAAAYTGIAYLITVALLLLPYFFCASPIQALIMCLIAATLIISLFTLLVSRIRNSSFWPAFLKMFLISMVVAGISFLISWGASKVWGIDI